MMKQLEKYVQYMIGERANNMRPFHEIERALQQQWLDTLLAADHDLRYSLRQLKNLEDQQPCRKVDRRVGTVAPHAERWSGR